MNKTELIAEVAKKMRHVQEGRREALLNATFDTIADALSCGRQGPAGWLRRF